jgi:hypothetical protein
VSDPGHKLIAVTARDKLTDRDLNRALLARQGLLEPLDASLTETVEAIGAIQAQYWPAVAAALFSRMRGITLDDVYGAFERRELVVGSSIRGTIHAVSASEHPLYSAVAEVTGANISRAKGAGTDTGLTVLRAAILDFAATEPRDTKEFAAFAEQWVKANAGALTPEVLEYHRSTGWRPIHHNSALIRVPSDGRWTVATGPKTYLAASVPPGDPDKALTALVRRHLGAFGPAAADDVATWLGTRVPVVRDVLDGFGDELVRYRDESGRRTLYDLPGAPLPDADAPAPPRLLPKFDSTLLAYAAKFRGRIVPDEHRQAVYLKALQVAATYLIDGHVAGNWAIAVKGKKAVLTLQPLAPLRKADRTALVEEAERMLRLQYRESASYEVEVAE